MRCAGAVSAAPALVSGKENESMPELIVAPHEAGLRLTELLQRRYPAAPAAYLRQLVRSGRVHCAGGTADDGVPLLSGRAVTLPASRRLAEFAAAAPFAVLAESGRWICIDKPSGLAVHRGADPEEVNVTDLLNTIFQERGAPFRLAPVHRLDRDTSGPLLFAKGRAAAAALGRLFTEQLVGKRYLALATGRLPVTGELLTPVVAKGKEKEALTRYRTVRSSAAASLLELELVTGRQHQIRVQLATLGHPLYGDHRYGGPAAGLKRLFLHAACLEFSDPDSHEPVRISAPLPPELVAVAEKFFPDLSPETL